MVSQTANAFLVLHCAHSVETIYIGIARAFEETHTYGRCTLLISPSYICIIAMPHIVHIIYLVLNIGLNQNANDSLLLFIYRFNCAVKMHDSPEKWFGAPNAHVMLWLLLLFNMLCILATTHI